MSEQRVDYLRHRRTESSPDTAHRWQEGEPC